MGLHRAALAAPAVLALGALLLAVQLLTGISLLAAQTLTDVVAVGCALAYWRHGRALCELCVGYLPPDPDAAVAAHRPALHYCHLPIAAPVSIAVAVLVAASTVAPAAVMLTMQATSFGYWAYLLRADIWHRRLTPWCPWCRGGHGHSDLDAPGPRLTATR